MNKRIARLILTLATVLVVAFVMAALTTPVKSVEPPERAVEVDEPEDYENQKIEAALLEKANKIEDCTVTWYPHEAPLPYLCPLPPLLECVQKGT